ncbi:MAG: epoxyqueuosine reductase QueH [Bacillota bacterium]|nr:epoxyqueuosine reductase QueH [Bacillota bacterium]
MNMRNYQKEMDLLLLKISEENEIKTLLLHSCCAPCSSYVIEYLSDFFNIDVLYYNPNISLKEEYEKRKEEQQKFLSLFPAKHTVRFFEGDYNRKDFLDLSVGLEHEKEGGIRCEKCYHMRLFAAAKAAKEHGSDYFATTLTISPLKSAEKINLIGEDLGKEFGVNYLCSDFKKKNGYKRSIELSAQYSLYRQNYCGCVFSKCSLNNN